MNTTLDDVPKIKTHDEIDGAWVLTNDVYKTSMIYGPKMILLGSILLDQLKTFIKYFREEISNDSKLSSSGIMFSRQTDACFWEKHLLPRWTAQPSLMQWLLHYEKLRYF